uniref:E4 protein n=1 Tax=Human papillomavirus TaxID=10566 RepID=A0A385PMS1_9PAPI|nr:MAG: E4 protein [Human papillomavirus]
MCKMNNIPFHLTAQLGGLRVDSPSRPPPSTTSNLPPPGTPRPRRFTDEERNKHRRRVLGLPFGGRLDDDDDEKENKAPPKDDDEEEPLPQAPIAQLLEKLERAIDQLSDQVLRDLSDFKRKLGIRS